MNLQYWVIRSALSLARDRIGISRDQLLNVLILPKVCPFHAIFSEPTCVKEDTADDICSFSGGFSGGRLGASGRADKRWINRG